MTRATLLASSAAILLAAPLVGAQASATTTEEAREEEEEARDERTALRGEIARLKAAMALLEERLDKMEGRASPLDMRGGGATGQQGRPVQNAVLASPAPADKKTPPGPATEILWKGAPHFVQGDARFKPKGRIQMDAGYLASPANSRARGFSSEFRRIRLGGEGALGSGFGYKLEAELSDNAVRLVDTFITYQKGRLLVTLGNQNAFQALDELISDTSGSVMERAAFTTGFGFERRLGLSAQYQAGPWLLQGGIFTDSIDSIADTGPEVNGGDKNDSFGLDGRVVFAPKLKGDQLHFAASYHWRDLGRLRDGFQHYRVRPFLHSVNDRYIATQRMQVESENHHGIEAAGVFDRFHYAAEAHWLKAGRPGLPDPTYFGAYGEVGVFLTKGDSRPYSNGILGSPKPANPFGKGGIGAVQLNMRYDYLSLDDRDAGVNGGRQNGIIAAAIWTPIQYLRFNLNYAHLSYTDAAILAGTRRNYDVDVVGARAELDF